MLNLVFVPASVFGAACVGFPDLVEACAPRQENVAIVATQTLGGGALSTKYMYERNLWDRVSVGFYTFCYFSPCFCVFLQVLHTFCSFSFVIVLLFCRTRSMQLPCYSKYTYKYVGACTRTAKGSDLDQVLSRI